MTQYQQTVGAAVTRFGGHVAHYLGDGLLVYFGWPSAREDDPERAIRGGLAILDAMAPLNAQLAASSGTHLAVRIGMHTGPVVIAAGGEVFGETPNVAARVQGAAAPDTVVISAATQRLVAGMFVVEDRGPQELKGVREPVTLYRVLQPSGVRSRLDVVAGRLTRFVGRDMEIGTLLDRWSGRGTAMGNCRRPRRSGSRQVALRLPAARAPGVVPHTWLECGATPYTEGTPFHPIIALVPQGLGLPPGSPPPSSSASWRSDSARSPRRRPWPCSPTFQPAAADEAAASPELQRRKTMDLLVQWTLSVSAAQPLSWSWRICTGATCRRWKLLGHLIAQSPEARVLLVVTARPEFTPPWLARSNLTTVQLARLTKGQARDMIATLAGTDLPAVTLDALVERADGVPLYVEELTKAVMEPGGARGVERSPPALPTR